MDILSFAESFVETINRTFFAAQEKQKRERKRKNADDDDRLVATVAGNTVFIPIRRYDTPKRSAACSFACASVQQWYQPYTSPG